MSVRPVVLISRPPTRLPVPEPGGPGRVLAVAADRLAAGVGGAMATVLARRGSSPATPGQKLYLGADGACVGTVGGGAVERAVLEDLARLAARPDPGGRREPGEGHAVRTFRLGPDLGMCCGGQVDVMLEPLVPAEPCLLVGAGHVGRALAPLLAGLGFDVTVVDPREEWALPDPQPGVRVLTAGVPDLDRVAAAIDPRGACLVMTHDHALDQQAIEWALRRRFALVGGVGSRAKAARVRSRLTAAGFEPTAGERVRMPLGVDIGARTPEEIAVAIAAELVAWRTGR